MLAALATVALLAAAATGLGHAALALAPALLVALPPLLGHYPGERTIERIAARRTGAGRPHVQRRVLPRAPLSLVRRPQLLATLSASRAPPAVSRI